MIEELEELFYVNLLGYSREELEEHRANYSLREREVLIKDREYFTPEESDIYKSVVEREALARKQNSEIKKRFDSQIIDLMKLGFKKDLINALKTDSSFKEIKITRQAFEKAETIAKRVVEISKTPDEIYFHLTGNEILSDVYIPHQRVTPSLCEILPGKDMEDRRNIELSGSKIAGWSHSHGINRNFHSATDIDNLQNLPFLYGMQRTLLLDTYSSDKPVEFKVNFIPSIVVNSRGDKPSLAISIEYFEFLDYEPKIKINQDVKLNLVEGTELDYTNIDRDIFERVQTQSGFKDHFARLFDSPPDSGQIVKELFDLRRRTSELEKRVLALEANK